VPLKKPTTIVKLKKRNPSPAQPQVPLKQELYGLDVDFLRELNLGDML
jgi:hypothetical protein